MKDEERDLLCKVYALIQDSSYANLSEAMESFVFNPQIKDKFQSFMCEPVCIREDMEVLSRFDLSSFTCKVNTIVLFFQSELEVHEEWLTDKEIRIIYNGLNKAVDVRNTGDHSKKVENNSVVFQSNAIKGSEEHINQLEAFITEYPMFAEALLKQEIPCDTSQVLCPIIRTLFTPVRTYDATAYFTRYVLYPYVYSGFKADRYITEALKAAFTIHHRILIDELISPMFYSTVFSPHHVNLFSSLINDSQIASMTLSRVFTLRNPEIQPMLTKNAFDWLKKTIDKTVSLDADTVTSILKHMMVQSTYNNSGPSSILLTLIQKKYTTTEQHKHLSKRILETMPPNKRHIAETLMK